MLTVVLMGVALWVRLAIAPVSAGLQYVTFFPSVTLAAIGWGFRAGLLATAIGLVLATCIFTPPYYSISWEVLQTSLWSNMVFLTDGVIISFAIESLHRYRLRSAIELRATQDAHAVLMDSTQYLRTILDNLFAYVALLDLNGVIKEVNQAPLEKTGHTREDVLGVRFYDTPWWSYDENVRLQLMRAIEAAKQGRLQRYDVVVRMGDALIPIDFQISPVRDLQGRIDGLLATGVDISERKQMETALRQSQTMLAQFKYSLDHTQDGVFIFRPDTLRFVYANHGAMEQLGYGEDELMRMTPLDIKPRFTEPVFRDMLQPLLDGRLTANTFETVHRRKDGRDIPVEIVLQLVQQDGSEARFIAFARDISERKRAESELRVAAAAFESAEGIMITDADNVILRINKAFTKATGYSAEEIIGKTPSLLKSGRHDAAFYAAMWESIRNTGSWEGEIWDRRKNGEIYPKLLTITAVKSEDGQVSHYIGSQIDITARKMAEEDIRNLAFYDPLTQLPNRRLLLERLGHAQATSARSRRYGGVLFIDLDNFKALNDTLGHDMGDLLLQQVALRLVTCVREGDTAARLGGDEFVLMLEDLGDSFEESRSRVETVGEKIIAMLNQPFALADHVYCCTPSIGVTLFRGRQHSMDELLKQADLAMYGAKKAGRNTLRFFDAAMNPTAAQ
ncbi:MAG: PAS domain S-box protein [Sterolibacteriaceae bacterium MAG5]|nr:PAS domain S-box protein [Candidatus Nitricoxidireducens bremensis]